MCIRDRNGHNVCASFTSDVTQAGSGSSRFSYRLPGKNRQASPHPMVTTTSAAWTISSVKGLGKLAGDVDADLVHDGDGCGVDLDARLGVTAL